MNKLSEEQRLRPIYNGRPLTREGPPIVLHEPTFADIQDKLDGISSMPVDEDLVTDVAELVARAAEIYKGETERQSQTLPILSKLLNVAMDEFAHANNGGGRKVAGGYVIATCNLSLSRHKAILAYFEWKVELGIGGEGSIQGALTLRKLLSADRVGTTVLLSVRVSILVRPLVREGAECFEVPLPSCYYGWAIHHVLRIYILGHLRGPTLHGLHISCWHTIRNQSAPSPHIQVFLHL